MYFVICIADASDRREHAVVLEGLGVEGRRILAAPVGMCDQPEVGARLTGAERHSERVEDEVGAHVAGELPADHPAAVNIDDEREEHHSLPAAQI